MKKKIMITLMAVLMITALALFACPTMAPDVDVGKLWSAPAAEIADLTVNQVGTNIAAPGTASAAMSQHILIDSAGPVLMTAPAPAPCNEFPLYMALGVFLPLYVTRGRNRSKPYDFKGTGSHLSSDNTSRNARTGRSPQDGIHMTAA